MQCLTITRRMLSLQTVASLLLLVLMFISGSTKASQLEIEAFQPAVVPIRAITTLTLQTSVELNVTSNTSLQCRFKDISVPARIVDGFVFCDTPAMRNTDRVSVYLDIDGKLFKTKKPLYLHEPFKVSNITPSVISPAQNVHLTVSGITCKDWMQYFVRFQTANGTKKTQQGICRDSVVSCYVPEFPPNTRLRVGLTLSNRLVEWADRKILIQYPIDAMKSSVKDVNKDAAKKGAFTFVVVLRDRFRNFIKVIKRDNKEQARISVQYSPKDKPDSMRFLECTTTLRSHGTGDEFVLSCAGVEKEHIYFYPSINNVPLGGQDKYEARTTLCPGKNSCEALADPKSYVLIIALSCVGVVLVVSLVVAFMFVRYKIAKKQRVTPELEMEIQLPENVDRKENVVLLSMQYKHCINSALETSDTEEGAVASPTHENVSDDEESISDSSEVHLGVSGALRECKEGHQGGGDEKDKSNERIEMKLLYQLENFALEVSDDEGQTQPNISDEACDDSSELRLSASEARKQCHQRHQGDHEECKQGHQGEHKGGEGGHGGDENNGQSDERIKMKIQQFEHDSEISAAEEFKETAGLNVLSDSKPSSGDETLTMTEFSNNFQDAEQSVHTDGPNMSNVSSCEEECKL